MMVMVRLLGMLIVMTTGSDNSNNAAVGNSDRE